MENNILRRYHYKIWFPKNIPEMTLEFFENIGNIGITHHAGFQLIEDRRGIIPMPTKEQLMNPLNKVIEVYEILHKSVPTGKIQKMILRLSNLSDIYDYSYVLARESIIVSAWCNSKTDDHRLVDSMEDYYCPDSLKEVVFSNIKKKAKKYTNVDFL